MAQGQKNGRSRSKKNRTALVLAGGGLTGVAYEIGALQALDDFLFEWSVNDFDIYVGTSAGALVAAGLANGLHPNEMLRAIDGTHPQVQPVVNREILRLNKGETLYRALDLPGRLVAAGRRYLSNVGRVTEMSLLDMVWSSLDLLPSALYESVAPEEYIRQVLLGMGGRDSFAELEKELDIVATNLENGERQVFNRYSSEEVPISRAVAASSAIPVLYKPVKIGNVDYVDGGLRGNASLDLAIEQGADLIICVNPLVPYDNSEEETNSALISDDNLSDNGLQTVISQVFRVVTHAGIHYHIKQLRRAHPDVDILLIEPARDDTKMAFRNIMRTAMLLKVADHAYDSVACRLAEDYESHQAMLDRHRILLQSYASIQTSMERRLWERNGQHTEESITVPDKRYPIQRPIYQLTRALTELDMTLDQTDGDGL